MTGALAQTSRGNISGLVTDTNGAVVSGANVTITNTATNVSRKSTTNDEGLYRFDAVDLGTYSVEIAATGFGTIVKTGIIVNANQTSTAEVQLTPGGQQVTKVVMMRDLDFSRLASTRPDIEIFGFFYESLNAWPGRGSSEFPDEA